MRQRESTMNDDQNTRKLLGRLFDSEPLAVLATSDQGQPLTSLLAFMATEDLKYLVFLTRRTTRKFANLAEDNRVAMLIDSRSKQPDDFDTALAVTAVGTAEEAGDPDDRKLLKQFLSRHPRLEAFAAFDDVALVKVAVDHYDIVSRFEETTAFRP